MKKVEVKRPDIFQLAHAIVELATDENEQAEDTTKNPKAISSGRRGGLKGGKARAKKLTAQERKAIATKAAKSRWSK